MARHNDVRVASGYDQSLSDSNNIEDFTPTAGKQFRLAGVGQVYFAVETLPEYSAGQDRFDPNAGYSRAGYEVVRYRQPMCHADSLSWLITNYEGQVTAYLRTISTTYAEYNCQLRFEYSRLSNRPDWFDVIWDFTLIEAL